MQSPAFTKETILAAILFAKTMVSIGGLAVGISEEEFINGSFTHSRNRIIMDVFLRMKLIEKLGTGIRRIKSVHAVYPESPIFEVMKHSIKPMYGSKYGGIVC